MAKVEEFFTAIESADLATVRGLLDSDPGLLFQRAPDGASAALTALYNGHVPLADELAARSGSLSIYEAAALDDTDRLTELIEADQAVVEAWSPDGWQPLHLAAYFGRAESVRILLDADAPVQETSKNPIAVQPLHAAASGRHAEVVWLLIASGAAVDAPQQHGWRPLHAAAANGDAESIKALLSAGADPDLANDDGQTARDLAPDDAVRALLEGGG
ncbi:MAG TPA: ankyrin repeat domain-containing protein [Jatrophihabitans sp.]|jgi:ankyrin repeat protein